MAEKFIERAVEVERVAIAENVIFGEQREQIQRGRRRLWFEQLVVVTCTQCCGRPIDDQTTLHEHGDDKRAGNGLKAVTDARLAADDQIRMKIRCEVVLNESC